MPAYHDGKIDVHTHKLPQTYREALERASLGSSIRFPAWSPTMHLEMMDRHGIGASILSIAYPGTHWGDAEAAKRLARRLNEEAAETVAAEPRLGSFATLPLPDVALACAEAVHALDVLKLDGVSVLASYAGKYLGHPDYDPLLEVLNERAAAVHVHPTVHPSTETVALGVPNFLLEYPFDTTRAAVGLLFADALERYPNVKFILSHGGGTLPFLVWRIAAIATWQMSQPPADEAFLKERFRTSLTTRYEAVTPELIRSLVRRFWFDTALSPDRGTLSAVREIADPARILFGSDWPYAYETFVAAEIAELEKPNTATQHERVAIDRGNALALVPRLAA